MKSYDLNFNLKICEALDEFALLVDQPYNLGNKGDWFNCFRGGLYGMYARIYGIQYHFKIVHSWESKIVQMRQVESHVAAILFNMDSSLECFTFALNALGWAKAPLKFCDVESTGDLKKINPSNVHGGLRNQVIPGYAIYFPNLQNHWKNSRPLIDKIVEYHDVSKHREIIVSGGQIRNDPPQCYKTEIEGKKIPYSPFITMEEILLTKNPKLPSARRGTTKREDLDSIEYLADEFKVFIEKTFDLAYKDAKANIAISTNTFQK